MSRDKNNNSDKDIESVIDDLSREFTPLEDTREAKVLDPEFGNELSKKKEQTVEKAFKSEVSQEIQLRVTNLKKSHDELKEKYMRLVAEQENAKKRLETERLEIRKYKAIDLFYDLLPNIDLLETVVKSTGENSSEELKNYVKGFEMILNNIVSIIEQENVKKILPKRGDEFDSYNHEAVDEVETDEVAPGKIYEVKKNGYRLHDRLIFPAVVTVAKAKTNNGN